MNSKHFLQAISLGILTILPVHRVTADSFLDALLRFTGISVTASQVKGSNNFMEGDVWLVAVTAAGAFEPRKITCDGSYHTPLWIPKSQSILVMNGDKLLQLNAQGAEEKNLHTLTNSTVLLGFDKNNLNQVLVLQESLVGILRLTDGQITPLSYDKQNPEDRFKLDQLSSGFRDYGTTQVSIENQRKVDPRGHFQQFNTIHIQQGKKDIAINCPSACSQPALAADGRQLLFIGD